MANNDVQRLACPSFNGKEFNPQAARAFLHQYNNYATAYNLTDQQKYETLHTALVGPALDWFQSYIGFSQNDRLTWDHAKEAFLRNFTAPAPRAHRATMAANCKQFQGEPVRLFLVRCSNLALEISPPAPAGAIPAFHRRVTPDGAAAPVDVTWDLTADERATINKYYAQEVAINLFTAGCHENIKKVVSLNTSWTTFEELHAVAVAAEQTVAPQAISAQLTRYGAPKSSVCPVEDTAPPPAPAPVAPISKKKGKPRSKATRDRPQAKPHPNQHRTHNVDITCFYCGGKGHTERHCLAKNSNLAGPPIQPVQQQQAPPLAAAQQQAPPQQHHAEYQVAQVNQAPPQQGYFLHGE